MSILQNPATHVVGVDVSGNVVRFVQLRERRGSKQELVHFGSITLPPTTIRNGELINPPAFKQTFQKLLASLPAQSVCLVFPERHAFIKYLELKPVPSPELSEAVRWEAAQHIPYDLNELYADWAVLDHATPASTPVLFAAIPRTIADPFLESIEDAGFTPLTAEPVSLAAARLYGDQFSSDKVGVLLVLGDDESTAILIRNQIPILSASLTYTTNTAMQSLQDTFRLDREEAQKARLLIGFRKSRAHGVVRNTLGQHLVSLTKRIKEIEQFYHDHFQDSRPLSELLVCGSGATTAGLEEELTASLATRILHPQLPHSVTVGKHIRDFQKFITEFSIALGAALHAREVHNVLH